MSISNDDFFRFSKDRDTIQENVRQLLIRFPQTRDDYRILLFYFWHYVDGMISILPLEVARNLSSPESITRAYRQVTKNNPSLGPSRVTRRRRNAQVERYRRYYSKSEEEKRLTR